MKIVNPIKPFSYRTHIVRLESVSIRARQYPPLPCYKYICKCLQIFSPSKRKTSAAANGNLLTTFSAPPAVSRCYLCFLWPCNKIASRARKRATMVPRLALLGCVPLAFGRGDAAVTPFLRGTSTTQVRHEYHSTNSTLKNPYGACFFSVRTVYQSK